MFIRASVRRTRCLADWVCCLSRALSAGADLCLTPTIFGPWSYITPQTILTLGALIRSLIQLRSRCAN